MKLTNIGLYFLAEHLKDLRGCWLQKVFLKPNK